MLPGGAPAVPLSLSPPAQGSSQRASSLCPVMVCKNKGMTEKETVLMSSPLLQPPRTPGHSCTFCAWVPAVMLEYTLSPGKAPLPTQGWGWE